MLPPGDSYDAIRAAFRWRVPERYNMGVDCCDRWADGGGRLALLHVREGGGEPERITFDALKARTSRLANTLRAHGIGRGDRVAVLLPQVPEAAVASVSLTNVAVVELRPDPSRTSVQFLPDPAQLPFHSRNRDGGDNVSFGIAVSVIVPGPKSFEHAVCDVPDMEMPQKIPEGVLATLPLAFPLTETLTE